MGVSTCNRLKKPDTCAFDACVSNVEGCGFIADVPTCSSNNHFGDPPRLLRALWVLPVYGSLHGRR